MPRKGEHHSEEAKRKLSIAHKGKIHTKEHREKLIISNKGKKRTDVFRKNHSERFKGKKSHFWKGGVTASSAVIRSSLEYSLWREAVFKRDGYTCVWCGIKTGGGKAVFLNADHIKPFALFPELRFSIDNGRTLCNQCHATTDTFGIRGRKS